MTELTESERMIVTKYDLYFEGRLSKVESSIARLDNRIDAVEKNIDKLNIHMRDGFREIKTDFRWLALIMLGGFGTLFGFMAHGFKWF